MVRRLLCLFVTIAIAAPAIAQGPLAYASDPEIVFLEARVDRDDADPITPTRLGHAYLRRARESADFTAYRRAEQMFNLALARSPEHFGALTGLAAALSARHAFREALAVAERAIAANPDVADGYAAAGDAALEAGLHDIAARRFARVARMEPGYHADTRLANLAAARGEVTKAYAALDRAAAEGTRRQLNPTLIAWCHVRAGAIAWEHGDWSRAERSYRAALTVTPDSALALEHLAEVRAAQGFADEALTLYAKAIERSPQAEFHQAVGTIQLALGRSDAAAQAFARARAGYEAAAAAGDPGAYRRLALFYADIEPEPAPAVGWARKDFEIRQDPVTVGVLAWTLLKSGERDAAASAATRAVAGHPVDADTWYRAGVVALEQGDCAAGRVRLQRALRINPRGVMAPEARRRLQSGRRGGC